MTVPAYVTEEYKNQYQSGVLNWSAFVLAFTLPFNKNKPDKTNQRAMYIMLGADEPDNHRRTHWDYNDGKSYNGSFRRVIRESPGELESALKLCLRAFVATEDTALLAQRLKFIGNILVRHHEVYETIIDKELADLFLDRVTPLISPALKDPRSELGQECCDAMAYAFCLESKVHEKSPEDAQGLSGKFRNFAIGLCPLLDVKVAMDFPPTPATFAKQYLAGQHPRFSWQS